MDCANYFFASVFYNKHVCFYPPFFLFFCPRVHYHTNVAFISNSPRYLVALFVRVSFMVPVKASPESVGARGATRGKTVEKVRKTE